MKKHHRKSMVAMAFQKKKENNLNLSITLGTSTRKHHDH